MCRFPSFEERRRWPYLNTHVYPAQRSALKRHELGTAGINRKESSFEATQMGTDEEAGCKITERASGVSNRSGHRLCECEDMAFQV